ncbi:MAG: hypothetical protein F4Z31_05220 [Gemmatimonadetes bacterium]|nr:hypothetical protein [Gemmatimonadota bacterium]MYF08830.1 hypothetical protein [Rhodospirillaceae bacterium]MYJ63694.1 hypothetical protein [Acidimicrobiia bacterium]
MDDETATRRSASKPASDPEDVAGLVLMLLVPMVFSFALTIEAFLIYDFFNNTQLVGAVKVLGAVPLFIYFVLTLGNAA